MRVAPLVFTLIMAMGVMAEWKPPKNPDPQTILDEARADSRAGRYQDALAKYVWFHHHALDHDRSYAGVRLAPALMSWYRLGKEYPPALEKLKEVRDHVGKQVLEGKTNARQHFTDFAAINEQLGEEGRTVDTFISLDRKAPEIAKKLYDIAQSALVEAEKFALCGKYLEPDKSYARMVELYRLNLEYVATVEPSERNRYERESVERRFIEKAATLIALLVLNDRKLEAQEVAEKARTESKYPNRNAVIDAALDGKLPKSQSST